MWAYLSGIIIHPLHRVLCIWLCKFLVGLRGQEEVAVEKWEETGTLGFLQPLKLLARMGLKRKGLEPHTGGLRICPTGGDFTVVICFYGMAVLALVAERSLWRGSLLRGPCPCFVVRGAFRRGDSEWTHPHVIPAPHLLA